MPAIPFLQESISNVMQMHVVGGIPAEKMRSYISKTIYMSIAHYSPVLNVIAAQLWMNSWNNKMHRVAVPGSCSYLRPALPPLGSSPAWKGKKRLRRRKGSRDNSESQIPCLECVTGTPLQHGCLKPICVNVALMGPFCKTNYFQAIKDTYNCFLW